MTPREICIGCNMISGVGYIRYKAMLDHFGNIENIRTADRSDLQQVPGIGMQLAEKIINFDWDGELERETGIADRGGVRIYTLFDEAYPDVLRTLYDPPLCIYVRGKLPEFPDKAVAVVGSRRISRYGESMAAMLAREAVTAGFTVVSGLAIGVDSVAQRAVVEAGGVTVGVIGSGLMHLHPKENIPLARSIIENGGAVVSEFPLDFPVSRNNFPRRNRIVAVLARGTIVVEAGVDSGALITAHLAMENGRDVFAVPGRADNPQAQGCHKLIKEGAALIENFDDVASAWQLGLLPGLRAGEVSENGTVYEPDSFADLGNECAVICELLAKGESTIDDLQLATGFETGTLLANLMKLELKLLVTRGSDQYYRLNSKR